MHSSTDAPSRASSTPKITIKRRALVTGLSAAPIGALRAIAFPMGDDLIFAAIARWEKTKRTWKQPVRQRMLLDMEQEHVVGGRPPKTTITLPIYELFGSKIVDKEFGFSSHNEIEETFPYHHPFVRNAVCRKRRNRRAEREWRARRRAAHQQLTGLYELSRSERARLGRDALEDAAEKACEAHDAFLIGTSANPRLSRLRVP